MKRLLWLGLAVALLAGLLAPRLLPLAKSEPAPETAEAPPLVVDTTTLTPHRLQERLLATGSIRADERVRIHSEISGILKEIRFSEGSTVEAGELLVKIDDEQHVAERDRARFRAELARQRERRENELLDEGLISQDDYDRALNELNVLEAELRLAEARLAKTEIRAPFRGRVGLREVSEGAALTPQIPIVTLQAIDSVKIEFSVPERYAAAVRPGDRVSFRVRGSDRAFEGRVYALEPAVDAETRSLTARARSANPGGALLPGAFAEVEVVANEVENALSVPAIAVVPELGAKKVYVLEDGRAEPRIVVTGIRTESEVQIVSGLDPDERVIVSAVQQLRPGLPVIERAESGP